MSTTTTVLEQPQIDVQGAPSGPVTAEIIFYKAPEDGSKPFNYTYTPPPEGEPQRNFGSVNHNVVIQDIRGREREFDMNKTGFAALPHIDSQLKYEDWEDDAVVEAKYYPEVEKLLLDRVPGAKRVFLFDHTIRRTRPDSNRAPVTRAHIDQTDESALARVFHHLPEEADVLVKDRVRIINVWRPLQGPVKAFPLAMADSQSVPSEDLVGVEHRYKDRTGETAGVRFNDQHRWWYWSGMDTDERILLQCFDSQGGRARTAHTAFVDPRSAPAEGRESIEVRALVFG
jgi:hypothetical protein